MKLARTDAFFDVPLTTHPTSEGEVTLPVLYFDTSTLTAFFVSERGAAERALEGTGLVPGITLGSKVVTGIAFYAYRDTTVGRYNEVGLGIPVVPAEGPHSPFAFADLFRAPQKRTLGFYVLHLPVTTPAANAAGRELWGYPKFVTDIVVDLGERAFFGQVEGQAQDGTIVTLSGKLRRGAPVPPMSLVLYSHLGDRDLRTEVHVRGRAHLRSGDTMRLVVGDSRHPMASTIRDLGLDGRSPIAVTDTHLFQSRLHAGQKTTLRS